MNPKAEIFDPLKQAQRSSISVGGRMGGQKGGKQKHQQANHLVAFYSNKSTISNQNGGRHQDFRGQQPQQKALTRKKVSSTASYHSKEHFLATNYRYVVAAHANFIQTGFFDPDVMVAWEDIQLVIASLDKDLMAESCSICLEENIILPQLTKCGHLFCLTCLLRYLESEYSKKCPVCSRCTICRADLRDVLFVATPPPHLKSIATFSLLSKDKSSLYPVCHDPTCESLLSCPDLQSLLMNNKGEAAKFNVDFSAEACAVGIPEIDSKSSQFSMICYASEQKLVRFINQSLKTLENFRKLCLSAGTSAHPMDSRGDVEYLAAIPEAAALLTARKDLIKAQSEKRAGALPVPPTVSQLSVLPVMGAVPSPIWLYQHQAGHRSFLHPLCMRALLHQQALCQALPLPHTQTQTHTPTPVETTDDSSSLCQKEASVEVVDLACSIYEICLNDPASQPGVADSPLMANGVPLQITGRVLEIEVCRVTPEQRKRYPFIRHLPLDCEFSLVEVDMKSSLSSATYDHFRSQFQQREAARKAKRNKEQKEDKKDRQRMMLEQERIVAGRRELHQHHEEQKSSAIKALLCSPLVGTLEESPLVEVREDATSIQDTPTSRTNTFAIITALGVSNGEAFPSLGGEGGRSARSGEESSSLGSAWGAKVAASSGTWVRGAIVAAAATDGSGGVNDDKKKKGKTKFSSNSSLFATSSARSYR